MSTFDSEWNNAQVDGDQQSNFDPPADGEYIVELKKATALTSKKGDDWVVLELRELELGYDWTVMLGFKSQGQANLTKTACYRLGIQVDEISSLSDLSDQLESCAGGYYEIEVKTNGDYRNTYINGPARPQDARTDVPVPIDRADFQPVPDTADDDDIGF